MVRIATFEVVQEPKKSPQRKPRGKVGWWRKFQTGRKLHEFVEYHQEIVAVDLECACSLLGTRLPRLRSLRLGRNHEAHFIRSIAFV